ncbi:Sec14 cytosolic factor [Leucoagaricus sp. SymC.cos]|nr:Sec14 cytosolic factor [Leucoagaricus sp. SymC.cos]
MADVTATTVPVLQAASASALPEGITDPNYQPLPGRVGNLTVPQKHALDKLKKELQEEGHFVPERMDDAMLLRFLRARKFDVVKAKEMLLSAEQWRKDFGVDDIVKDFDFKEKEEVNKYYPQYYHKIDIVRPSPTPLPSLPTPYSPFPPPLLSPQDGRPIYIEQLGKIDVKALYSITSQQRLLQRLVLEYEKFQTQRLPSCSQHIGHPVETSCTIMDLNNVSLTSFYKVKDYVMAASSIGQDRYPETMGKFYIINAPWAFSAVWSVIKPWLDEVTVRKINILGGSYQEELLKQIGKENLPREFGGSCECEGGCSMSDAGPWNPRRY